MLAHLTLMLASFYTGIALYIAISEQPARLALDDKGALTQWRIAYLHSAPILAGLSLMAGSCAVAVYARWGGWGWLMGAALILLVWPYSWALIQPINRKLNLGEGDSRPLLEKWGRRHWVRTGLGVVATLIFFVTITNLGR